MKKQNAGRTADRIGGVGFTPDVVPGPQKTGARFAVLAHGSGRGISRSERKRNEGEIADLKVSDLESLNRKFLQKFSMNALGTLHFPFFLS